MKIPRLLSLGVLVTTMPLSASAEAPVAPEPIAIVYSLAGETSLTAPGADRRPLRLFDRLPAGTTIEIGSSSRLALAFANGLRYELGERSRVTLGAKDLASRAGPVRPLPRVPPFPVVVAIADEDRAGLRAGAVRIRSQRITGLYPRRGAASLAEDMVLRFRPVESAKAYQVGVHDRQGRKVFATETTTSMVPVPTELLDPGVSYRWTVSTADQVGFVLRGEAELFVLPKNAAEQREKLRKALEAAGDSASLSLLASVDQGLGLLAEAHEELRIALQISPGDAALAEALAELEWRLAEEP